MKETPPSPPDDLPSVLENGKNGLASCACSYDPFAHLPPELRPAPVHKKSALHKTKCLSCGASFWTNRESDNCMDCEQT